MYRTVVMIALVDSLFLLPAIIFNHAPSAWFIPLQLACCLLMGVVNLLILSPSIRAGRWANGLAQTRWLPVFSTGALVLLFELYYIAGNASLIVASAAAFLLPFMLFASWKAFLQLPARAYAAWQLPDSLQELSLSSLALGQRRQVQFSICRSASDQHESMYPVTGNAKTKLGKLFQHFIADNSKEPKSRKIDITNQQQLPYGWLFYEMRWMGCWRRALNPAQSLLQNGVKSNAIIKVVRHIREAV
ncbi:MAG TPA: TssN family type VI secretion system protein [Chitinophagaceae bacterium]|nr:TssN family type VI secretion system protein [Chitinophagaceae bacterium]